MQRPRVLCTLALAATGAILAACGGGGGGTSATPPVVGQGSVPMASARALDVSTRSAPVTCTPILTANPNTKLNPTRTIRFVGVPNDGNDEEEGQHEDRVRNIDGGGCDYGIYLGPNSKHARLRHARVHGAGHIQVVADGAEDFRISDTVVDGHGSDATGDGIWFAYGTTGSVERSIINDAFDGIVIINNARGLVGETLIKNMSFLGINVQGSNVVVEDVRVDNSMNVGGGVAIQYGSTGNLRNITAIGSGQPTVLPGPEDGFFFGNGAPSTVTTHNLTAIHMQRGFASYCAIGVNSVADLTNAGDRAINSTIAPFTVQTTGC